jgi:hypothetical protein
MGALRDLATRAVPESLRDRLAQQLDSFTTHLGGEPVRGHVLPEERPQEAAPDAEGDGHEEEARHDEERPGQHGRRSSSHRRR